MTNRPEKIRARIRRLYAPDAIYFITCVTHNRRGFFTNDDAINLLRQTMREVKRKYPFHMRAYVFLPDHVHLLIHIDVSTTISKVMHSIKRNFSLNFKRVQGIDGPLKCWQRGFWDHVIRDGRDYLNHMNYIHFNPVKNGLVERPVDYVHSSFHHYLHAGWYDADWGAVEPDDLKPMHFE